MIRVVVLGSTGSIGRSALEVIARHPGRFQVVALVAHRAAGELARQVARFRPRLAVLADPDSRVPADADGDTVWVAGRSALLDAAAYPEADVVLNALVGAAGLEPTLAALRAGHRLALANKESLVAGGDLVIAAQSRAGQIVPVDSEHSAILQCVQGCPAGSVHRVVLTASGGPFRGRNPRDLWHVRPSEALEHPTWDMGAKISIDSATLANKALEVIEAHYLYGLDYDHIDAVIHPQSIIHSFVELVDGSVLAQLGVPNMELPILYALSHPHRVEDATLRTYDPVRASPLTFEEIDGDAFPVFPLGAEAGRRGGCAPAVYNAANEVAVQLFLEGRIRFPEMADVVGGAMDLVGACAVHDVNDVLTADARARSAADDVARRLTKATGTTR